MSRRAKVAAIILVVLTACTLAMAAGLSVFANSRQGRVLLLKGINAAIPGTLSVSHHHVSLFSGVISLKDVNISDPWGNDVAGLDSLRADLSLTSLLKRTLVVENLDLKRPWARLSVDKSGRVNILNAFPAAETGSSKDSDIGTPFNIIVNKFNLSRGALDIASAAAEAGVRLVNISLVASGNLAEKNAVLKLSVEKSQLKFKGYQSDFKGIDLALAIKDGHVQPLVVKTENQFASLLLYGDIRRVFAKPELDLNLKVDLSMDAAESFFGIDQGNSGRLRVNLSLKGWLDNPALVLKAGYEGGTLLGHSVHRADLSAHMADRVVAINRLYADTGSGGLGFEGRMDLRRVFPKGFLSPGAGFDAATFEGRLQSMALDLAAIEALNDKVKGRLDGFLTARGKGLTFQTLHADAAAEISVNQFSVGEMAQPVDIRLRTSGGLRNSIFILDELEAEAAGARISASGNLDLTAKQIDTHFNLETGEVSSLLSLFGVSRVKGLCTLEGKVRGPLGNPGLHVNASGEALQYGNIEIGNVSMEAALDESGHLSISSLTVENRGSTVEAAGGIQLFESPYKLHRKMPLNADLVFSDVQYGNFMDRQDIEGRLTGSLELAGSVRSLMANADIKVRGVAFDRIHMGDMTGKLRFSKGSLLVDSIRLTNKKTDLGVDGEVRLFDENTWQASENPEFSLALSHGRIFMEDFVDNLEGMLVLEAQLGGRLGDPQGTLQVNGQHLDFGPQRVETVVISAKTGDRGVNIEPFRLVMPAGGAIEGSGRLGYDRSFQFQLHSNDLSIDSIDRLHALEFASGKLALDITGKGRLDHPEIDGRALLSEIRVKGEAMDDLTMQLGLNGKQATIKGKQTFDLDAGYDLSTKAYFMDLSLKHTKLASWFIIAGRPELGGNISGSIKAEGYAGDLERTRVAVDIQNLDVEFKGEPIGATKNIQGTFENRIFEVPGFQVDLLDQGHFFIKGSGDISGSVNLDVDGDIPLKAANWFVEDLPEIKGVLSLRASVAGTFQEPELNGEIGIENAGVTIPELQQELHSLNGRIVLSAGEKIVGDLSGMLDEGRFDISTTIALDGFLPGQIDARIRGAALPFQIPDTMEMLLNTDLVISGTPDGLLVKGDLVLLEGTYYKDFRMSLLQTLQAEKRETEAQALTFDNPYLKPLRFNINFKHRQPFVVDNNIADLEISPDIKLTGTPANPVITGLAKVDNGILTYQNKSFVVRRGSVDFSNPYKTEAEIDIKGEVEIREWLITISLYGTPDRLVVELSSYPPEEDADILSLLIFKKTTYELNEGSGGVGQSPTVLLAQVLASSYGDDIKDSTGIDILEVEAESAVDQYSTDRIKVTVGKELSERMTVKYSVETKDGGYVQRASTEYKLYEHILVSGFQDTKGVYGGEFIFRVEFRLFR